ncbi:MAG TPA: hypothetical protein VMA35_07905 [Candidatus Sulfopaludibacter sp.]|nr:hypothetical protein [Candidatus Sulfopaludibacter sp.]
MDDLQIAGAAKTAEPDRQLGLSVNDDGLAADPADKIRSDDPKLLFIHFTVKNQFLILTGFVSGNLDLARLGPGDMEASALPDFVGAEHFSVHPAGFIHNAQGAISLVEFPVCVNREIFRNSFLHRRDEGLNQSRQCFRFHV